MKNSGNNELVACICIQIAERLREGAPFSKDAHPAFCTCARDALLKAAENPTPIALHDATVQLKILNEFFRKRSLLYHQKYRIV